MANAGFFLGGLSDTLNQGLQRQQQGAFQQQELQIQQQGQQMAQKRFDMARIDKLLSDVGDHIQQTIDAGKVAGEDPKKIQAAIQGMADQYRQLATSAGYKGMADANLAAWFAAPPSTKVMEAQAAAKVNPLEAAKPQVIEEGLEGPQYGTYNKKTQKYELIQGQRDASSYGSVIGKPGEDILANTDTSATTPASAVQTDADVKGQAFLNKYSPRVQGIIKGIADYTINPQTLPTRIAKGATQSQREMFVEAAQQYAAARGQTYDQTKFPAANKAMQQFAQRVTALGLADQELRNSLPLLRKASEAVSRTEYKDINSIVEAWQGRTGGQAVVQLGEAINTAQNLYARAINPTGGKPTVNDLNKAHDILQQSWSKGQIESGITQMLQQIDAAKASLPDAKKEILEILRGNEPPAAPANSTKDQGRSPSGNKIPAPPPGFVIQ